jgi:hypothetical protein
LVLAEHGAQLICEANIYHGNLKNSEFHLYTAYSHRYLMSRLSLQVFYLWRHVLSTASPFILEVKFRNTICPLHRSSPFIGGLRCQAIQTEHGPYITERTQKAVYCILWVQ